jgi:CcmD family protein
MKKAVWGVKALLLVLVIASAVIAAGAGVAAWQPPAAQEGFVPVENVPVQEKLPAAPLVMAAYAVAWVTILAYLWSLWRRLGRVERDIAAVTRRVEAGSRR